MNGLSVIAENRSLNEFLRDPTVTVACVLLIAVSLAWIVVSRLIARNLSRARAARAGFGSLEQHRVAMPASPATRAVPTATRSSLRVTRRGRLALLAVIVAVCAGAAWAALATLVADDAADDRMKRLAAPTPRPSAPERKQTMKLITEGVTVQVLNATTSMAAQQDMESRLEELGFEVIVVNPAAGEYARTTVFWSFPEARKAAVALARRFGWLSDPKPSSLSPSVSIHVVVGQDEI
jgi:xanthine/uracil permease